MNDINEPDSQGISPDEVAETQLPLNILAFGEIEQDDVRVYIKQDVYKQLEKYALADTAHERGTILIGDFSNALGKTHVVISDYIEAKYTDASASTLTFTHETWDYVNKEHDSKFPDKKIIGWQHTHPGYGIFLSNYDLFIQDNFFNLPFQVAYVIDPIQQIRGFFQWKNGKTEKLKGYYLYDDVGKTIKIEQPEKKKQEKSSEKSGIFSVLAILAIIIACANLFLFFSLRTVLNNQQTSQEYLQESVATQEVQISGLQNNANSYSSNESERITELETTVAEMADTIDSQAQTIEAQQQELDDLRNRSDHSDEYIIYTIRNGDTLAKICKTLGIDYSECRETILAMNVLTDENMIYAGQELVLPKPEK